VTSVIFFSGGLILRYVPFLTPSRLLMSLHRGTLAPQCNTVLAIARHPLLHPLHTIVTQYSRSINMVLRSIDSSVVSEFMTSITDTSK